MASGGEQRAWRGSRPASISRPPPSQNQSKASSSPAPSSSATQPKASTAPSKPDAQKTRDTSTPKPTESAQPKPVPAAPSNVWEQRKNAQAKAKTAPAEPKDESKEGPKGAKADAKKGGEAATVVSTAVPTSKTVAPQEKHVSVNGFNTAEVEGFLARNVTPKTKAYKPEGTGKGNPWGAKAGNMANGQSFMNQLGKQVAELQNKR